MLLPRTLSLVALASLTACGLTSSSEPASDTAPAAASEVASAAQPAPNPAPASAPATDPMPTTSNNVYGLQAATLDGAPAELANYKGKVTLIVNVASACGYTPQYAGLQKLHAELAGRGFAVLGFPSNEFGGQEPGSADEIRQFCSSKYGVEFPMFAKVETKSGPAQSSVYGALEGATGKLPNWNFCKYLVGKDGQPLAFYPSKVAPDAPELREAIEKALL